MKQITLADWRTKQSRPLEDSIDLDARAHKQVLLQLNLKIQNQGLSEVAGRIAVVPTTHGKHKKTSEVFWWQPSEKKQKKEYRKTYVQPYKQIQLVLTVFTTM